MPPIPYMRLQAYGLEVKGAVWSKRFLLTSCSKPMRAFRAATWAWCRVSLALPAFSSSKNCSLSSILSVNSRASPWRTCSREADSPHLCGCVELG
jgi:hypothetical protein